MAAIVFTSSIDAIAPCAHVCADRHVRDRPAKNKCSSNRNKPTEVCMPRDGFRHARRRSPRRKHGRSASSDVTNADWYDGTRVQQTTSSAVVLPPPSPTLLANDGTCRLPSFGSGGLSADSGRLPPHCPATRRPRYTDQRRKSASIGRLGDLPIANLQFHSNG